VQRGSTAHRTEFFGPLLSVMRFETLNEAIDLVNDTGYGLTSGLQSLDEREHALWKAKARAGNLYINRGTTGAIVLRQPFGGMGKSCVGPGLKAGGPNYVAQFMRFEDGKAEPASRSWDNEQLAELSENILESISLLGESHGRIIAALASYDCWWADEFSREHDHFLLLGQDNVRRYLPFREIRVRITEADSVFDVFARAAAVRLTGARVLVSSPPELNHAAAILLDRWTDSWGGSIEFIEESDEDVAQWIRELPAHAEERIRYAGAERVSKLIRVAAAGSGIYLADEPVLAEGRIELLWYLREQSISKDYHRYGNLGARAAEKRSEPL
jgi:RHH-type proline utilization regulon transcriptional repressor/proline dehydrogenase/delta 1-pyrroline-5-carboxylate dehydrogenase